VLNSYSGKELVRVADKKHRSFTMRGRSDSLMSEDMVRVKGQLVQSYLAVHGCVQVHYTKDGEFIFFLTLDQRECQFWVSREWFDVPTRLSISDRLDRLQVIPFLQNHLLARVGVKGGEDVLTCMA
jgi:hypothetical protein